MALRVIGAGFGRTGTASAKLALEHLGFGPCYHMSEVFSTPERVGQWMQVAGGAPDWDAVFDGYASCVDFPACTYWRELAAAYPEAKVLLTVRDPEKWFESVHSTIMSPRFVEFLRGSPMNDFMQASVFSVFDGKVGDRAHMLACFERHVETVRREIPAERLLVYELREGWGPLCEFLGVDVPAEAFPHVNSKDEIARLLDQLIAAGPEGMDAAAAELTRGLFKPVG